MAIREYNLTYRLETLMSHVKRGVLLGSVSASLEEYSTWTMGEVRCAVQVFERYSAFGGNRLSLSVTYTALGDRVHVCAVTAGGSKAVVWKVNTVGENNFLCAFERVMEDLRRT